MRFYITRRKLRLCPPNFASSHQCFLKLRNGILHSLFQRIHILSLANDQIIQSVLHQKVVATGNPLMLVQFRQNLQRIEHELERIEKASDMDGELLTPIRSMLEILEGFKEQPRTLADMKHLTVPNEE